MSEKTKKKPIDQSEIEEKCEQEAKNYHEEQEEKEDDAAVSVYWYQRFMKAESEKALIRRELAAERDKMIKAERKMLKVESQMLKVETKLLKVEKKLIRSREATNKAKKFQEEANTELQCPICSEVYVEATTTNCGHTFCHFCIHKWMQLGHENCPVCRMKVTQKVAVKTLDNYTDKVYEQCESETRRAERSTLKEERLKLRRESGREAEREEQRELLREGIEAWQAHYWQAEREAMAWLAQWQADSEREEEREGVLEEDREAEREEEIEGLQEAQRDAQREELREIWREAERETEREARREAVARREQQQQSLQQASRQLQYDTSSISITRTPHVIRAQQFLEREELQEAWREAQREELQEEWREAQLWLWQMKELERRD